MFRTAICTTTLIIVAAVAQAEAGGFKGKFHGGNHHRQNHHGGHHGGGHHHRHANAHHNNHHYQNHHNYAHHNKYHHAKQYHYQKPAHYGYQQHYVKQDHAPVQKQYYQVCYHCDAWGYHKYEVFTCPNEAAAYVGQLQQTGYYASVSETYEPYESGHIVYKQQEYNHWMP